MELNGPLSRFNEGLTNDASSISKRIMHDWGLTYAGDILTLGVYYPLFNAQVRRAITLFTRKKSNFDEKGQKRKYLS